MTSLPSQLELQSLFSGFLFETGLSAVSIKNYLSDIRHFLFFCASIQTYDDQSTVKEIFQDLPRFQELYVAEQKKSFTPKNTINRRLASIRRFSTFLATKFGLIANSKESITPAVSEDNSLPTINKIVDHFKIFLVKEKKSHSTVKNYISDLNHFFAWSASNTPFIDQKLENILSESQLNAYVTYLKLSHTSTSVINRRQSSIKQFTRYCFLQQYIPTNPFEYKRETPRLLPLSWFERLTTKKKDKDHDDRKSGIALLYQKYSSLPFTPYLHLAILVLATSAMVIFGYNQIIKQAKTSSAAVPTVPRRQLSFQGRLTDSSGNAITTPVNVVFKLWNDLTAGTQLYTSSTCSITPDTNGIFNTLIGGGTCGQEIANTVFTENRDVFLEVSVGSETLTPRQQIATVGYALNSETLQGYPASAAATINTVPVIDNNGDINIAVNSPTINSTSGTFTLNGQALTLSTTANSGGDIVLQPDAIGGGQVLVLGATTNQDTFRITNANLTSGSLISGYIGNNTSTGRLLSLTSGSTETDRFYVGANGQTMINTASTLANAGLIINQNGSGNLISASSSGSTKFTVTNNGDVNITGNYLVNGSPLSGSNWQRTLGSLTPVHITDSINIGAIASSSAYVHLGGTSGENSWINNGNFGIGTTTPNAKLNVYKSTLSNVSLTMGADAAMTIKNESGELAFGMEDTSPYAYWMQTRYTGDVARNLVINPLGGNVGIGNTNPSTPLQVTGEIRSTNDTTANTGAFRLYNTGDSRTIALIQANGTSGNNDDGELTLYRDGTSLIHLSTVENSYIAPNSSLVGIGTTTPNYKLDVAGDINFTGALRTNGSAGTAGQVLSSTGTGASWVNISALTSQYWQLNNGVLSPIDLSYSLNLGATATSSALVHLAGKSGENSFINTGNFGIGTISPTSKLYIQASTGNLLTINDTVSDIVNVSSAQTTFNNPTSFTSAGDVTMAYDLNFTNPTASYIKSSSPLIIQAGETFNSSDLTLNTFNKGNVIVNSEALYTSGSATISGALAVTGNSDFTTLAAGGLVKAAAGTGRLGIASSGTDFESPLTFSNGLTRTVNAVKLGGTLTASTDIPLAGYNLTFSGGSGNVGIGTSTPGGKLDVNGTGVFRDSVSIVRQIQNNYSTGFSVYKRGNDSDINGSVLSGAELGYNSFYGWNGTANDRGAYILAATTEDWTTTATGTRLQFATTPNGSSANSVRMTIGENGYVGIGTDTPSAKLDIVGNATTSGILSFRGSADPKIRILNGENLTFQTSPGGDTGLSDRLTILNTGNIGIGNTSPTYKLDVTGDINLTGALRSSGNAGTSGQILSSTGTGTAWIDSASVGTNYWQLNGGVLSPSTISESINLGAIATASATVHLAGISGENSFINTGNFGLGTNSPTAMLDVHGNSIFQSPLAFDAVFYYSGSTYTDYTAEAKISRGSSYPTLATSTARRFYVGKSSTFSNVYMDFSTGGQGITLVAKYSKGSGVWGTLTITDGTNNFNQDGVISFTPPTDWATDTVNSSTQYWIEFSSTTTPSVSASAYLTTPSDGSNIFSVYANAGDTTGGIYTDASGLTVINNANWISGFGAWTTTSTISSSRSSIATNSSDGFIINASTNATSGTPVQYSPRIRYTGRAWNTTSSASNSINWITEVKPTSGTTPTGALTFSYDLNGGGYSEKFRIDSTGNVGIGNSSPNYTLDVAGDINLTGALRSSGNAGVAGQVLSSTGTGVAWINAPTGGSGSSVWNETGSVISPINILDAVNLGNAATASATVHLAGTSGDNSFINTGNFGIGLNNPTYKLDVTGDINFTGALRTNGSAGSNGQILSSTGTGVSWIDPSSIATAQYWQLNSGILSPSIINQSINLGATATASAYVHLAGMSGENSWINNGNVGIGTTNPTQKLDINGGNIKLTFPDQGTGGNNYLTLGYKAGYSGLVFDMTGSSSSIVNFFSNMRTLNQSYIRATGINTSNYIEIKNDDTNSYITNGGAGNLILQSTTGNVGIGTTTPTTKLDVKGIAGLGVFNAASSSGASLLNVAATGNVGIGTNSPASALELASGQISVPLGSSATPSYSFTGDLNTGLFSPSSDILGFSSGGFERFRLNSAYFASSNATGIITGGTYLARDAGTVSAPTYSFGGDTDTGMYRYDANSIALATNGVDRIQINNTGATISGSLRLSSLSTGILHSDVNGNITSSGLNLSTDVTGILPILNGGTNNDGVTSPYVSGKFLAFDGTRYVSTAYDQSSFQLALTFQNGLTSALNTVEFGGANPLLHDTNVNQSSFNMSFTGTGNFGIGTAAPVRKLDVAGFFVVDTDNYRVGIGTATPSAKLEIAGSTSRISNTSGDITFDSASNEFDFSGDSLKNFLNATVSGQVQLGRFADAGRPATLGAGSLIYSTTQNTVQYNDGSSWKSLTNYFNRTDEGILYPSLSSTDSINLFSTSNGATSSAMIRLSGSSINNSFFMNPLALGFNTAIDQPRTGYTYALETSGGILPKTDATDRLGYSNHNWMELYLSNDIIKGSTAVIELGSYSLSGATWHSTAGFKVADASLPGYDPNLTAGNIFEVTGNATISAKLNVGPIAIDGNLNKIDVGTIDPPYTINGHKYATYMTSMVGIKEELVGKTTTTETNYINGLGYRTLIDLDQQPVGSDIWLFSNATNIQSHINDLSVLLTPEGQAKAWYEVDTANKILAIYTSTPTNVTYRLTAPRFDSANWSNNRNSSSVGHVVADVNNLYSNSNSIFDNPITSPELIAKLDGSGTYSLNINGVANKEVSSFLSSIIANLQAGAATVANLVADNLTVHTKLISPLADIDQLNATNATISGTLYANDIKGQTVDTLHNQINLLNEKYSTASAILADLQAKYSTYDSLFGATSSATITGSDPLALSPLATSSAIIPSDLALNSLNVHTLIGNDILANGSIFTKSISAFDTNLYIQPAGDKLVYISKNLMILDPDGIVSINGNLVVSGNILADSATISSTLAIGSSTIATGSANFNQLTTGGLVIAAGTDPLATTSGQTNSNATIGVAAIATGSSEISILNNKVTPTTLIYITPTSDTAGRVLFVKSKTEGVGFTVGITGDSNTPETSFNYWLVETK